MHFFFYGTLTHQHANPVTAAIRDALGPGRRAWVRGGLHAVESADGWYPALDSAGRGRVMGYCYAAGARFDAATLALLDAYENYVPQRPRASEYLRRRVPVRLARGGVLLAHAYLWNRPLTGALRPVPHGDFARFLAEAGVPALSSGLAGAPARWA